MVADERELLDLKGVLELVGCSRASLYLWMTKAGFPRPLKLGPRSNRWDLGEVREWLDSRPRATIGGKSS